MLTTGVLPSVTVQCYQTIIDCIPYAMSFIPVTSSFPSWKPVSPTPLPKIVTNIIIFKLREMNAMISMNKCGFCCLSVKTLGENICEGTKK